MKGIVFTEFLEMTESKFGFVVADKIIVGADLQSNGVYTTVKSYNEDELFILIDKLSLEVKIPKSELMIYLGEKLYTSFLRDYSPRLLSLESSLSFPERLENYILLEVMRIYPKAKSTKIEINQLSSDSLVITYYVSNRIAELIEGIILGYISICKEEIGVNKRCVKVSGLDAYQFIIKK